MIKGFFLKYLFIYLFCDTENLVNFFIKNEQN